MRCGVRSNHTSSATSQQAAPSASTIRAREAAALAKVSAGFVAAKGATEALHALLPVLGELRYFRRFLDEVSAAEDDLDGASGGQDVAL